MAPDISLRGLFASFGQALSQLPLQGSNVNPLEAVLAPSAPSAVAPYIPLSGAPTCPIDGPASCHNSTAAPDSCCFVHPGGQILLTQFWDDEVHVGGAEEDFTLHGLWPDLCDGSYDQFCNLTPLYPDIRTTLKMHKQSELLEFMDRYWVANRGPNSRLWAHEYNKHATCINTLAPSCYSDDYRSGIEVVDYFTRATSLFKLLDTYRALERAGITPDHNKVYDREEIENALEEFSGGKAVMRCSGSRRNILHEVWYVYFVKGSLQSGEFVPAKEVGGHLAKGNCAAGVRYPPKTKKRRW